MLVGWLRAYKEAINITRCSSISASTSGRLEGRCAEEGGCRWEDPRVLVSLVPGSGGHTRHAEGRRGVRGWF